MDEVSAESVDVRLKIMKLLPDLNDKKGKSNSGGLISIFDSEQKSTFCSKNIFKGRLNSIEVAISTSQKMMNFRKIAMKLERLVAASQNCLRSKARRLSIR